MALRAEETTKPTLPVSPSISGRFACETSTGRKCHRLGIHGPMRFGGVSWTLWSLDKVGEDVASGCIGIIGEHEIAIACHRNSLTEAFLHTTMSWWQMAPF